MNPAKFPRTNAAGAKAFGAWLVSGEAQRLIESCEKDRDGALLLFPNSDEWRKTHASWEDHGDLHRDSTASSLDPS